MNVSLQVVSLFVLTTGVGWLMMMLGYSKRTLDWTRRARCPGCGREIVQGRCGCQG